jgi:hypothetical protein
VALFFLYSCWGILNAPASGLAMAELIVDGHAHSIDLTPFLHSVPCRMACHTRGNVRVVTSPQWEGFLQPVVPRPSPRETPEPQPYALLSRPGGRTTTLSLTAAAAAGAREGAEDTASAAREEQRPVPGGMGEKGFCTSYPCWNPFPRRIWNWPNI